MPFLEAKKKIPKNSYSSQGTRKKVQLSSCGTAIAAAALINVQTFTLKPDNLDLCSQKPSKDFQLFVIGRCEL